MYKKMKKLEDFLFKGEVIVSLFSVFLIGIGLYLILKPVVMPVDLDKMSISEVSEGRFVSLKTFILVQGYASETGTESDYSYYLIAGVDKNEQSYFMGLRVTSEEGDRIVNLANVSTDYFWFTDQFYYGKLYKVQDETKIYFDEAITSLNEALPIAYYYLDATPGSYKSTDIIRVGLGWFISLLGGVMLIITLIMTTRNSKRLKSLV
jgi:hypothetical protein